MANDRALVEEKEAESYEYIDKVKETILPHTSRTGGIEGVKDPYPAIKYRKFEGERLVQESELTNIKHPELVEEEPSIGFVAPSLGGDPIQDPSLPVPPTRAGIKQPDSISSVHPVATTPIDPNLEMMRMMKEMVMQQRVAPPQNEPPKSSSIPTDGIITDTKGEYTSVTFTGPFGEVSAPFQKVVDGELCVALVQDTNSAFNYNPPIADDVSILMEWQEKSSKRTQPVINAGLSFKLSKTEKVIVLLKDGS